MKSVNEAIGTKEKKEINKARKGLTEYMVVYSYWDLHHPTPTVPTGC